MTSMYSCCLCTTTKERITTFLCIHRWACIARARPPVPKASHIQLTDFWRQRQLSFLMVGEKSLLNEEDVLKQWGWDLISAKTEEETRDPSHWVMLPGLKWKGLMFMCVRVCVCACVRCMCVFVWVCVWVCECKFCTSTSPPQPPAACCLTLLYDRARDVQ
jgi:hypothetical protein